MGAYEGRGRSPCSARGVKIPPAQRFSGDRARPEPHALPCPQRLPYPPVIERTPTSTVRTTACTTHEQLPSIRTYRLRDVTNTRRAEVDLHSRLEPTMLRCRTPASSPTTAR